MKNVLQRPDWHGNPQKQGELFSVVPDVIADRVPDDRRALYVRNDEAAIFSVRADRILRAKGWVRARDITEREAYIDSRCGRPLSAEEAAIAATLPHDGD
jgi:hypothetical protein